MLNLLKSGSLGLLITLLGYGLPSQAAERSPVSDPLQTSQDASPSRLAQTPTPGVGDTPLEGPFQPETDGASPSREPLPEFSPLPADPAPDSLLTPEPPLPTENVPQSDRSGTVVIERFELVGGTVFSEAEIADIAAPYANRPITFEEILEVRDAINRRYREAGFVTSGAIVPPQNLQSGTLRLQAVEGSIEEIIIEGTRRLLPGYIRSRLSLATGTPLQVDRLLERLQLLRLDPLIEAISADLQAGIRPGTNLLVVSVVEADSFSGRYTLDNGRSPTVGTIRNRFQLTERNVSGLGDTLSLSYAVTQGSNDIDVLYRLPVNRYDGTVTLSFGTTNSDVIEDPFDALNISSDATVFETSFRQPLIKTPTQEFALGITASRQSTRTFLGIDDIGAFPLSAGADSEGRTRVSVLRFFQEWTQRDTQQVLALRSQFNLGIDILDATANDGDIPDGQFFSWLGQGQWIQLLKPDTPLVVKGSLQLTPDPLLTLERYGIGGPNTVRGYRQDEILSDNGANLSVEVRLPLWRSAAHDGLLQVTPFIEGGFGWNNKGPDPDPGSLLSIGTGLQLQFNELDFRVDWGIPLTNDDGSDNTLQEQGITFSLGYTFF